MSDAPVSEKESAAALLEQATAELTRGHFAAARKLLAASNQANGSDEAAVREQCAALWRRLSPDPLVALLIQVVVQLCIYAFMAYVIYKLLTVW